MQQQILLKYTPMTLFNIHCFYSSIDPALSLQHTMQCTACFPHHIFVGRVWFGWSLQLGPLSKEISKFTNIILPQTPLLQGKGSCDIRALSWLSLFSSHVTWSLHYAVSRFYGKGAYGNSYLLLLKLWSHTKILYVWCNLGAHSVMTTNITKRMSKKIFTKAPIETLINDLIAKDRLIFSLTSSVPKPSSLCVH